MLELLAWGLHILIDIPTHQGIFATAFPLATVSGRHFRHALGEPSILLANYCTLVLVYV